VDASLRVGVDGLVRRPALVADGFDEAEIDRMLRSGALVRVRRGVYRLAGRDSTGAAAEHRLRARAAAPGLLSGAVFGFVTAAVLLGLPVWRIPLRRLHVVRDRSNGARIRGDLQIHSGRLREGDVLELTGGLRVTAPARTVVDLARTVPAPQALVTLDGALHRGIVAERVRRPDPSATTTGEISRALEPAAGSSGARAARRALALADGLSESPGETLSRFRMHVAGLPPPVLQWPVPDTRFRADFAWPDRGLVGEFDGRTKYGRALRPGTDPAEVLWQEKRREDRIRAEGLAVVRWVFPEIDDPGPNGMTARLGPLVGR